MYNKINRPEAHFAIPAEDTRQEDFMKVQTLAALFHSFHTALPRTKYSCFLAISPDFLPHIVIPCPPPLCWSEITKEIYLQKYLFSQLLFDL